MVENLRQMFKDTCPTNVDYASLRYVNEQSEMLVVEKEIPLPIDKSLDRGLMVTVAKNQSYGYAATSNISSEGIRSAFAQALSWCERTKNISLKGISSFP